MDYLIRNELAGDYRVVEEITRKAFWNIHVPGCDEHYLVNIMRSHKDFVPELDFVLELQHKVIASIMYTKSKLIDESGNEKPILTFGPVSVLPEFQRKGYGKSIINYTFDIARQMGNNVIVIFGNPSNYVGLGFKSCRKYNICYGKDIYPTALLVKELKENSIDKNTNWIYQESDVYNIDKDRADEFDSGFEALEKEITPSQEEFYILSNSRVITSST